jgi:oligopeptide/dipeptide ABC transporter ATP-binding protein
MAATVSRPDPLLSVEALEVRYRMRDAAIKALFDVSFELNEGEILGIVGESGCGKSTLSAALLGLLPHNGEVTGGRIVLGGRNLLELDPEELRQVRGSEAVMVFQDPLSSLNPTFTIGTQMFDVQRAHVGRRQASATALRDRAAEMLERVGIPDARDRVRDYPHQFSGGMRQRTMIAMALMLEPGLLIADEPTSALDVTLQVQILELLRRLRDDLGTAIVFVSHDLGAVAQLCDRVVVMYAGRAVEQGEVNSIFEDPRHPYTQALLAAIPSYRRRGEAMATIPGRVPMLSKLPPGCTFAPRCRYARTPCLAAEPELELTDGGGVRCFIYDPSSGYERSASAATVANPNGAA